MLRYAQLVAYLQQLSASYVPTNKPAACEKQNQERGQSSTLRLSLLLHQGHRQLRALLRLVVHRADLRVQNLISWTDLLSNPHEVAAPLVTRSLRTARPMEVEILLLSFPLWCLKAACQLQKPKYNELIWDYPGLR